MDYFKELVLVHLRNRLLEVGKYWHRAFEDKLPPEGPRRRGSTLHMPLLPPSDP